MPEPINPRPNWLHLDLKGTIPAEPMLLRWLDWLAECGFNGVVWEVEDRIPWQSWPGTHRPGYDADAWQRILAHCQTLNLEIVPLVQTQGHLEWLLKHDRWAGWREDGHWSELCPHHPEAMPALLKWLDEVIAMHPQSRYLHLGADETWHLASCPICAKEAASAPHGKMSVYLDHVGQLCEAVVARGLRPMIWADMFWREERPEAAAQLPEQTILVDWQYGGPGPWDSTAALPETHLLLGASAVRCGYEAHQALAPLAPRLENVLGWHEQMDAGRVAGLIHTTWGRANSLSPIYGPWQGWLPGFIAAGNPARWESHPFHAAIAAVDQAMGGPEWSEPAETIQMLERLDVRHPFEQQAVQWWILALRHHSLLHGLTRLTVGWEGYRSGERNIGLDPDRVRAHEQNARRWQEHVDEWERDVRQFWRDSELGDVEAYLAAKLDNFRSVFEAVVSTESVAP